jgi:hypothetical protein
MKATLGLELFGDNIMRQMQATRRSLNELGPGLGDEIIGKVPAGTWVAEIIGHDLRYGYQRQFSGEPPDYTRANSKGSRGVFAWYILESGRTYEVKAQLSWSRTERYFCFVSPEGEIIRIDKEEVDAWLRLKNGNAD